MTENRIVLGIESTCDETAAAVVRGGHEVLGEWCASQIDLHARFGGVVPEIACRAHTEIITRGIDHALQEADTDLRTLDAIAVSHRPGLAGSILVGLSAGKALAWTWGLPLLAIDHVEAHAYSAHLEHRVEHPYLALVASGGHTSLYLAHEAGKYEAIGQTLDDAAGEAFDKAARLLGLPYPGGPAIEEAALQGDPNAVDFPRPMLNSPTLDFSFSGLKTSLLYRKKGQDAKSPDLPSLPIADLAASFQEAVVDVLVAKSLRAAQEHDLSRIAVCGGVACNRRLREVLSLRCQEKGFSCFFPHPSLCTDNAVMIAGLGHTHLLRGQLAPLELEIG